MLNMNICNFDLTNVVFHGLLYILLLNDDTGSRVEVLKKECGAVAARVMD